MELDQLTSSPDAPLPFGKYLLFGSIGHGGMAEVYLGRPRAQHRLVAIKVIKKELAEDTQFVNMFIREGRLSVLLNHEAIVKTYEIGRIFGRHFICMEYISGVDLSLVLRRCRPSTGRRLPIPHSLYIAHRLCEGLHYAHQLADPSGNLVNLVNRDVSPSNIRISYEGDVKLLDFGIAKATTGLSSEIGTLKGKVSHMSPEQVRGLPLDRRSDVFSLGIILHEMLTTERLFRADSEFQLMNHVREARVSPPSASNPRVPAPVDALVLRALAKNPADRFQSCEEMRLALRDLLARYNFAKAELRDLVREVCSDEWSREQQTLAGCLRDEVEGGASGPVIEEDYGDFVEVFLDDAVRPATPTKPKTPRWIYGLLIASVFLLILAVTLMLLLPGKK